jgi:hypothetical protein
MLDPLDYPMKGRLFHFAEQDFLTRWRIQKHESLGLPPTPEEIARAQTRLVQMRDRLERLAQEYGGARR